MAEVTVFDYEIGMLLFRLDDSEFYKIVSFDRGFFYVLPVKYMADEQSMSYVHILDDVHTLYRIATKTEQVLYDKGL